MRVAKQVIWFRPVYLPLLEYECQNRVLCSVRVQFVAALFGWPPALITAASRSLRALLSRGILIKKTVFSRESESAAENSDESEIKASKRKPEKSPVRSSRDMQFQPTEIRNSRRAPCIEFWWEDRFAAVAFFLFRPVEANEHALRALLQ